MLIKLRGDGSRSNKQKVQIPLTCKGCGNILKKKGTDKHELCGKCKRDR